MHQVRAAVAEDLPSWLELAAGVEPLFGPMPDLDRHILRNIDRGTALVVGGQGVVEGGMLLSRDGLPHRISWLAVRGSSRRRGIGAELVRAALARWPDGDVSVVTFTADLPAGRAARRLYERLGFVEDPAARVGTDGHPRDLLVLRRSGGQAWDTGSSRSR